MKKVIIINLCLACITTIAFAQTGNRAAQADPSNLNAPANAQPVPNSNTVEKGAPTPKPLIAPPANPIPPVYPGAEAKVVETQTNLIFPASPPAPTQPAQNEPLSPVEATNNLQPTRPFRDEQSRNVQPVNINRTSANPVTELKNEQPQMKRSSTNNKVNNPVLVVADPEKPVKSDVRPWVSSRETIAMKVDGSVRRDSMQKKTNYHKGKKN